MVSAISRTLTAVMFSKKLDLKMSLKEKLSVMIELMVMVHCSNLFIFSRKRGIVHILRKRRRGDPGG